MPAPVRSWRLDPIREWDRSGFKPWQEWPITWRRPLGIFGIAAALLLIVLVQEIRYVVDGVRAA